MPAPPRDAPAYVGDCYRVLLGLALPWDSDGWEVDRVLGAYTYTLGVVTDRRDDSGWRADLAEAVESWIASGEAEAARFVDLLVDEKLWPIGLWPVEVPKAQLALPVRP